MIKPQLKVPENQLRELRRGSKLLLQVDPVPPPANTVEWTPPTSSKVGWEGLNAVQLRDAAFADSDPILPSHLVP
jgi:hypothetical protein